MGSHGYLHNIRNTVAHAVLQEQEAAIKAIDQDIDLAILELRWDESHVELAILDSPLAIALPSESTV